MTKETKKKVKKAFYAAKQREAATCLMAMGAKPKDGLKKAVYSGLELSGSIPVKKLGITLERPDVDKFFRLVETGSIS